MIRLRRPSDDEIRAVLGVVDRPHNYSEVGATADPAALATLPRGYAVDRYRFSLGSGRALFETARTCVLGWRHYEIPWLELRRATPGVEVGQVVGSLVRSLGIWFLTPCRVIYAELGEPSSNSVSFAYGTLAGHVERGEERFTVRFDPATELVSYEILAFSRPAVLLARLGQPWVRFLQRRFAGASAMALARACDGAPERQHHA